MFTNNNSIYEPPGNITVIIPVYNRAESVIRAVESVLSQTYSPAEIIIVDDGSDDDPGESLSRQNDIRLKIIRQKNTGVAGARNAGIKAASFDWLAFLDSDDWWQPGKLAAQVDWHKAHPDYLISQTDEIWIRNGLRVNPKKYHAKPEGDIFALSLERCLISPSAVLINSHLFEEVGLFDVDLPVCEDYDLWLRISARYPVGLIPDKLVIKTGGHADQLSRKYWGMDRFRVKAIEKLLAAGTLTEVQQTAALDCLERKATILRNGAAKRGKAL
jgi:glycosyltransferase involved in cell wall biosynthesis